MTKRMLGLEVVLAVSIVSVTAGITQLVPFLKERGVNINLGTTMAQALDRTDLTAANDFRYVHVKMENNQQLAGEHFGNEISSDMQVWGYKKNTRASFTTTANGDEPEHTMHALMLPDQDRGCLAADGYYECEPWPEINMEPLTSGELVLEPMYVTKKQTGDVTNYYLTFYTAQPIPKRTTQDMSESEFDFSRNSIGYSDTGVPATEDTAVTFNQFDEDKKLYRQVVDISVVFETAQPRTADSMDPIDLDSTTVQFQLDQSHDGESLVYELNIAKLNIRQLTNQEIEQSQKQYRDQLKQQQFSGPNIIEMILNDGPFGIMHRLQEEQVDLNTPVEQSTMQYNGKTAKRAVYAFPVNTAASNLERYVEIILDPTTQTIFEYTLLDEQKGMVSRVTFLENKLITDMDPATFFTEEHWKNELHLVEGRNPNFPLPAATPPSERTEIVQPE